MKVGKLIEKLREFFLEDIWRAAPLDNSGKVGKIIRPAKILVLLFYNLKANNCYLRASALTYYSIFALVPIGAMLFGIAHGFGLEENLKNVVMENFSTHKNVVEICCNYIENTLRQTKGGVIAGIGVVLLFYSVLKMMSNIEHSFNEIWGIKVNRSWFRKFSDYMSLMLICPILIVAGTSLNVFINTFLTRFAADFPEVSFLMSPMTTVAIKFLPFVVCWILFVFIYRYAPNTKVQWQAAVIAGVISGTLYQFWQILYIDAQVGLSKYNAIYGSLSALPLFLIWMQISWLVVLFGTALTYVLQNVGNSDFEPTQSHRPSMLFRHKVAILLCAFIVEDFMAQKLAPGDKELAERGNLSPRVVNEVLYELQQARLVSMVVVDEDEHLFGFQPALPLGDLTVCEVVYRLGSAQSDADFGHDMTGLTQLDQIFNDIYHGAMASSGNVLIKNIKL